MIPRVPSKIKSETEKDGCGKVLEILEIRGSGFDLGAITAFVGTKPRR